MKIKPTAVDAAIFGTGIVLKLALPNSYAEDVERFIGRFKADNEYELKQVRKTRSLNSNAYLWVLCSKIADAIQTTKEEVYKTLVARKGWFVELQFESQEVMDAFTLNWEKNGLGFVSIVVDEPLCIAHYYYGSSRYSQEKMNVLLEEAVSEAKSLGLETLTPEELARMEDVK